MNTANVHQRNSTNDPHDSSETAGGSFSIAVLIGAIAFAGLAMALAIVAVAQSVQV